MQHLKGLCALGRRPRLKLKWTEIIQVVAQPALDGRMPDFSNPDPTPLTAISKTDIHIRHAPSSKVASKGLPPFVIVRPLLPCAFQNAQDAHNNVADARNLGLRARNATLAPTPSCPSPTISR